VTCDVDGRSFFRSTWKKLTVLPVGRQISNVTAWPRLILQLTNIATGTAVVEKMYDVRGKRCQAEGCIRQPGFGHPVRHIPPHPTPATPSRAIDVLCCAVLADTHTLSWYFVKTFVRSIRCRQSSAGRVKQESAMLAAVSTRP